MEESREQRTERRIKEAHELNRPGYWSCERCTAHNYTTYRHCIVCGTLNWQLKRLMDGKD